ncbi:hypothetical protein [Hymenobacter antarcticus]|uniref:DUF4249 domain-containing protein n=1 Tax=Hymenobacter antarcticus TaxID=486270 RepID=A0ABP7Q7H3_9BACT
MPLLALTASCEEPVKPNGNVMPDPLVFVLLDKQGNELFTSEDTPIRVSSFNSRGQRFYIESQTEYPDGKTKMIQPTSPSAPYRFVYSSLGIPLASSQGSKEWYLELNGKTDTLHYDVRHARPKALYNQFDVVAVSFHGKPVAASGDPLKSVYYVLRRLR